MNLLQESSRYYFDDGKVILVSDKEMRFSVTTKKNSIELCTISAWENLSTKKATFLYHGDMIRGKTNMGSGGAGGGIEY